MAEDFIRYDILTQDALRGVVRKVLAEAAKTGLPGEHHFYVSFETTAPGVRISSRLLAEYPQEMTIVVQHQFWDLKVSEHSFEIGLSFDGVPERLLVPFNALKGFLDPSVQFGLQFEKTTGDHLAASGSDAESESAPALPAAVEDDQATVAPTPSPTSSTDGTSDAEQEPGDNDDDDTDRPDADDIREADVVSLDAFRKK